VTTPTPVCPTCSGPFLLGHPSGDLTVQHRHPCPLGDAQDARQFADAEMVTGDYAPPTFDRPATVTEVRLAAVLGLPAPDHVTVTLLSSSTAVVRRHPVVVT
jgi:hypothetical protein